MEKTKVLKDCSLDGLTNGEINIIYESCIGSSNVIGCVNNKAVEYRSLKTLEEKDQYIKKLKECQKNTESVKNFNLEYISPSGFKGPSV